MGSTSATRRRDRELPEQPTLADRREWPCDTSIAEVVCFVSREFATHLLLWVARMREKDFTGAAAECSNLRRITARVEAFQRMIQRRGPAQEKPNDESYPRSSR
jgi:hypothetical protein